MPPAVPGFRHGPFSPGAGAFSTSQGQAARNTVARLLRPGLVEEVTAEGSLPACRRDEEGGHALRITAAELLAIGIKPEREERAAPGEDVPGPPADEPANGAALAALPRPDSKQAVVVALLSREVVEAIASGTISSGATLSSLCSQPFSWDEQEDQLIRPAPAVL